MSELSCAVVSDLLPLYVEGMLSQETQASVAGHLDTCEACRAKYRQMAEAVPPDRREENKKEAMPLKRLYLYLILIILGFPVWFPLLAATVAVALSIYLVIWVLALSLWAVPVSLTAGFLGGIVGLVASFVFGFGRPLAWVFLIGFILVCAGLAALSFLLCYLLTKGVISFTVYLTKKLSGLISGRGRDGNDKSC